MIARRFCTIRSLAICISLVCFPGIMCAQTQPRMGLVAQGVGWALLSQGTVYNPNDHLFWTSDDGANWRDVTPQDPGSRQIAGVFFLDTSRGWVLLALKHEWPKNSQEPDNFITDIRGFDLASTTDGGASWTIKRLAVLAEGVGWTSAAQIFFLDAAHGWMNIESPVPHWGGEGVHLTTTDGGNTWKHIVEVGGGAGYGSIRFTDLQNGWIAGGPGGFYLYATNDGGRHWREVTLPAPAEISGLFENVAAQYVSPWFKDGKHGFLSVEYSGEAKSGEDISIQTLFSTGDGGNTWHLESWAKLDPTSNFPIVAVVDSTALTPKRVDHEPGRLLKLGLAGKLTETRASESPEMPAGAALVSLSFNDVTHGWASSSDGRLLSTTDGGVTWKDITPARKKVSMSLPLNNNISGTAGAVAAQISQVAPPTCRTAPAAWRHHNSSAG